MPDRTAPPKLRQPSEQLPLLPGPKTVRAAVSDPQGGPGHRYPCGLTADEIVANVITTEFDAVEIAAD